MFRQKAIPGSYWNERNFKLGNEVKKNDNSETRIKSTLFPDFRTVKTGFKPGP